MQPQDGDNQTFLSKFDEIVALAAERAAAVDTGGPGNDLIRDNIRRLAEIGYYGDSIPNPPGLGFADDQRRDCAERLAAACGATAFAQNQLHGGASFVNGGSNDTLKQTTLPKLCSGETLCGVAFAHLRRPGAPAVSATKIDGGYLVNGSAPWVTVWGMLDAFILGATIDPTGEMLFAYVDRKAAGSHLKPSEAITLAVMTASDTVSVELKDLFVPDDTILNIQPPDHMTRSDYCAITSHVTLPLGCARGSVDYLRSLNRPSTTEAADLLESEINTCRAESIDWSGARSEANGYQNNALRVRGTAINLALRAAETSIAASGGRAHLLTHPAQRRLREAGFYSTMAITADTQTTLMEMFTHAC